MRTLALEEVYPVIHQINRVQEGRSISLDVDELQKTIEKVDQIQIHDPVDALEQ